MQYMCVFQKKPHIDFYIILTTKYIHLMQVLIDASSKETCVSFLGSFHWESGYHLDAEHFILNFTAISRIFFPILFCSTN